MGRRTPDASPRAGRWSSRAWTCRRRSTRRRRPAAARRGGAAGAAGSRRAGRAAPRARSRAAAAPWTSSGSCRLATSCRSSSAASSRSGGSSSTGTGPRGSPAAPAPAPHRRRCRRRRHTGGHGEPAGGGLAEVLDGEGTVAAAVAVRCGDVLDGGMQWWAPPVARRRPRDRRDGRRHGVHLGIPQRLLVPLPPCQPDPKERALTCAYCQPLCHPFR